MAEKIPTNYFMYRDFELVQPIYDLAFLLSLKASLDKAVEQKYRVTSLVKAAHSLDGYSNMVAGWLDGNTRNNELDYLPSARIREILQGIKKSGTVNNHDTYSPEAAGCLRLRSVRGLGVNHISEFHKGEPFSRVLVSIARKVGATPQELLSIYHGLKPLRWQSAHVIPPLFRLCNRIEAQFREKVTWEFLGIDDPISVIGDGFKVFLNSNSGQDSYLLISAAVEQDPFFRLKESIDSRLVIQHRMGWHFEILIRTGPPGDFFLHHLIRLLDPLATEFPDGLHSDLHTHTSWSDGLATPDDMSGSALARGLEFIAVTDHSRSSKIQGGLTPPVWLRQAMSLSRLRKEGKVLHGMEVDILADGTLDMPHNIFGGMDLVIGSVHSRWSTFPEQDTQRISGALGSGQIDILAHPTTCLTGRPGQPTYFRAPAVMDWDAIFDQCSAMQIALEVNCFPSRFDLSRDLLKRAVQAGCWISLGSDAHSRSHMDHLKYGAVIASQAGADKILNVLSSKEIMEWKKQARENRKWRSKYSISKQANIGQLLQARNRTPPTLIAHCRGEMKIPEGSIVVGIDLTGNENKKTALAVLSGNVVETESLRTDSEILDFIKKTRPTIVSIDSPLGLPGGGSEIDPEAGIVRVAERDLASVGISAYPALINSMEKLTLRGIKLCREISVLDCHPKVIESYPGAAQDILSIPRKQRGLNLLRAGAQTVGSYWPRAIHQFT